MEELAKQDMTSLLMKRAELTAAWRTAMLRAERIGALVTEELLDEGGTHGITPELAKMMAVNDERRVEADDEVLRLANEIEKLSAQIAAHNYEQREAMLPVSRRRKSSEEVTEEMRIFSEAFGTRAEAPRP